MLALLFAAQIAAASPVVTVPATADLSIAGANLPAGACSGGASSTAHFSIAGRAFQAPRERVNDVVPAEPRIVGMHAGGAVDLEMSASATCPEDALPAEVLFIRTEGATLPQGIVLTTRPPSAEPAEMTALRRGGQGCGELLHGYMLCAGPRGEDGLTSRFALISMTADSRFGGALFMICLRVAEPDNFHCAITGKKDGVSYTAPLAPGLPTLADLTTADAAAFAILSGTR